MVVKKKINEIHIIRHLDKEANQYLKTKKLFIEAIHKKRKLNEYDNTEETEKNTNLNEYEQELKKNYDAYVDILMYTEERDRKLIKAIESDLLKRGFEDFEDTKPLKINKIVKNFKGDYSLIHELKNLKEHVKYAFYLPIDDDDDSFGHYLVHFFLSSGTIHKKFNLKVLAVEKKGTGNGLKAMKNLFNICIANKALIYVYESLKSARDFWESIKKKKLIVGYTLIEEHTLNTQKYILEGELFNNIVDLKYKETPLLESLNYSSSDSDSDSISDVSKSGRQIVDDNPESEYESFGGTSESESDDKIGDISE